MYHIHVHVSHACITNVNADVKLLTLTPHLCWGMEYSQCTLHCVYYSELVSIVIAQCLNSVLAICTLIIVEYCKQ